MANPNPPLENLRPCPPWPPGTSGNPAGHSRARRFTDALMKLIEGSEQPEKFIKVGWDAALKGDFRFWSYLYDRLEPQAQQAEGTDRKTALAEAEAAIAQEGAKHEP